MGLHDSNGALCASGHHELSAAPSRPSTLGRRLARVLGLLMQAPVELGRRLGLHRLSLAAIAYMDVRENAIDVSSP